MTDKLTEARKHHQAGRVKEAYALYREVIAADAGNLEAIYHYGNLVRQTGNIDAARAIFREALTMAPDEPLFHATLGEIERDLGRSEKAIKCFKKALRLNDRDYVSFTNLGVCYQNNGALADAREALGRAVEIEPDFSPAVNNLAIVLHRMGQERDDPGLIGEAIAAFRRAIEIEPRNANALANLAVALQKQRQFDEAAKACIKALELEPGHLVAHDTLTTVLITVRDFEQARDVLEHSVTHHPENVGFWQKLAGIYYQGDQYFEAIQSFKRLTQLLPDDPKPRVVLGTICNEVSQFEDAAAAFGSAIELGAKSPGTYRSLGQALARLDRIGEARAAMEAGLALDPEDETLQFAAAALSAEKIKAAPATYVADLFDNFAEHFDERLLEALDYRTPQLLADAVGEVLDGAEAKLNIADLGCGTGLCGPLFKPFAGNLLGTDLSPKMIEKARGTGVYDDLRVEALEDTLNKGAGAIDLAIAADVFVYIGDLDPVFAAARAGLAPRGLFAFSIEVSDKESFTVGTTFRFSHSHDYIAKLADEHGFEVVTGEDAVIRTESGQPVNGGIYILRAGKKKPGASNARP